MQQSNPDWNLTMATISQNYELYQWYESLQIELQNCNETLRSIVGNSYLTDKLLKERDSIWQEIRECRKELTAAHWDSRLTKSE
jgi:hypothetical protein